MSPVPPDGLRRRNGLARRDPWTVATTALLLAAAAIVLATFRDYGSTWDERAQAEVGRDVVAWFASSGRDDRALSGGSNGNLHLYGGLFEAAVELAAAALPLDPVETRHLLNALVALAGAVGAALLARRLGGPRAAFLAAALLLTTPPWWGHGFANSKDVPFAAAYPWLLLALLRACDELPRPAPRKLAAAGAALGAALALRPGALVLLAPLAAAVVAVRLFPSLRAAPEARSGIALAAAWRLGAILGLGWLGMIAVWPYGLLNPLSGPAAAVAAARRFGWDGLVRFAGSWVRSTDLPRSYAPGWFLATLPESWFAVGVAGAIAAAVALRRDRIRPALAPPWLDPALVAASGFGPIAAAVAMPPVLYDGVRHLLFAVPALAALGGWALSRAVDLLPRRAAGAALAVTGALAILATVDAARLHPYQYLYFNRAVAGGLEGASRDYELDYWGATGREAMAWVARNVGPRGDRPATVSTTADPSVASHWIDGDPALRSRFLFQQSGIEVLGPPDLRLATTRWFDHRATGRVLHVVERMGVPLLYVIEATPEGWPLVLEGGDAAVALPPASGWSGVARVEAGEERATYVLARGDAVVQAWLRTPRSGGVPAVDDLRAEVAGLAASVLGAPPGAVEPEPVAGPAARGWIAKIGRAGPDGRFAAVGAAHLGGAAIVLLVRHAGDPERAADELLGWLRGARLAEAPERRRP